jgi:uncharacterized protein YqeY
MRALRSCSEGSAEKYNRRGFSLNIVVGNILRSRALLEKRKQLQSEGSPAGVPTAAIKRNCEANSVVGNKMSLQEQITSDLHQAQKKGDKARISALRLIKSGIQYAEIAKGASLDDAGVIDVINKEVKQRRESIEGFTKGNRSDLVEKEKTELAMLLDYLPKQISRQEIIEIIRKVVGEVGAKGHGDKGKVMSKLMPQVKGKADGREVGSIVDELLAAL